MKGKRECLRADDEAIVSEGDGLVGYSYGEVARMECTPRDDDGVGAWDKVNGNTGDGCYKGWRSCYSMCSWHGKSLGLTADDID